MAFTEVCNGLRGPSCFSGGTNPSGRLEIFHHREVTPSDKKVRSVFELYSKSGRFSIDSEVVINCCNRDYDTSSHGVENTKIFYEFIKVKSTIS